MVDKAGQELSVEISLSPMRWMRRDYLLGFVRPIGERKNLERQWQAELEEHKRRTMEAIKSSVRIYQITEKIERTLALTKNLLNTENESQLFESAARILTSEGLNYRDVSFLMVNETCLEVRHSTKPFTHGRFPLNDQNKYAQFVRRNFNFPELPKDEVLVPLRSRGNFLGLIEVNLLPRERIFFDDLRMVSEWQRNVLFTIGDIIGLHLDNLRLYTEVKRQSIIDPLTGAYNRHYFVGRLSAEMNRCARTTRPISMIFIDVDEFKAINDAHGHLQGDQVLRELGAIFMRNLREEDCVCRYGGDEFVALLPEVDADRAHLIAEKLLTAVREHRFYSLYSPEVTLPISISLGVSVLEKNQDEDLFLQAADAALYRAKKLGRNRYEAPPRAPVQPQT
jgi:diguanylate cyclase (GGDEF)-like protein